MKFTSLAVLGFLLPASVSAQCITTQFHLEFEGHCNYANLLTAFELFYADPIESHGCTSTAEEELQLLLGATSVHDICRGAFAGYDVLPFADIANKGGDFEQIYYNGGTDWNEQQQTNYPLNADGDPSYRLRTSHDQVGDAARIKNIYEGEAQYGMIEWPEYLTNFQPDTCEYNAAMCCWPKDRQANDNNGNCNSPYDEDCIDKDPGDNTNLCYVDLERGSMSTGSESGYEMFPFDDANSNQDRGEGPIHCHGTAWSEDDNDKSSVYKGNNLFFISMYDHMHQRGYVKNIPGAPMCGCVEQMPIASRADCTQIDVEESFKITYSQGFTAELTHIDIDFNACQGLDRAGRGDNNDLWSYMNRLYQDGKVEADKISYLSKVLVGNDRECEVAEEWFMSDKGYIPGYEHNNLLWEQVAGRGALESAYYGTAAFDALFSESPNKIVRRVCADCFPTHQDIYYKRTTPQGDLDIIHNIANERVQVEGHVWGTDFELYSTYTDAVKGQNAWDCAAQGGYIYSQGFPGDCGPTRREADQDTRFFPQGGPKRDVALYVERDNLETKSDDPSILTRLNSFDVGAVARLGTALAETHTDGTTTIYLVASGADIYNTLDEFHYYPSTESSGDIELVVQVTDLKHKDSWTKAGLMIRENANADSAYFGIFVTGANGALMQYRQKDGDRTYSSYIRNLDLKWIKLVKTADVYMAWASETGEDDSWIKIGAPQHLYLADEENGGMNYAGLALTSHRDGEMAEAVFDDYEELFTVCEVTTRRLGSKRRL